MRNKIVLIKGQPNLAPQITNAPFERINADAIVFITALSNPQSMPDPAFQIDLPLLQSRITEILNFWEQQDLCYMLFAEYAKTIKEIGINDIKCVEGMSLNTPWFCECVKTYHRNLNQVIIECEVFDGYVEINQERLSLDEAISRLGPDSSFC